MFPVRLSVITYNLWRTMRWPLRKSALQHFVHVFRPDVLCLQELSAETLLFLDDTMSRHNRVQDGFPGWTCESNIFWNGDLLEEVEHGAEDVGLVEEHRRLFWVRLRLKGQDRTILVSTAHFTYKGYPSELETGRSPRLEQTHRTVEALQHLVREGEPALFMGDLNDTSHPIHILHEAGYTSCFAALGVPSPPTAPSYPTANIPIGSPALNQTLDWIVSNGHARAVAAQVPHFYHADMAPSDHWPVLAVYEI